ncbi:hypothetical protein A6E15_07540 [Natrinema saccharevitans]|uniref:HTTM domain-containing protein n=1 Tax=Natrinema saccharevitans TaxID=301967 RepID=A0A1S8AW92_9EURY|nr:hypothetical protein [Natrinema saccharevitans]OLZ40851.1 hypothetical protein A6E15_07540 [Natrinema saccharevitans]
MPEVDTLLRVMAVLTGCHVVYTTLELLSRPERYADGGMMDWSIREMTKSDRRFSWISDPILARFRLILFGRILVGIGVTILAALGELWLLTPFVGYLFFAELAILFRHNAGLSGGFHMALVVTSGLFVSLAAPSSSTLEAIGLLWIAAQGILGYLIPGVQKLTEKTWWDGSALVGVLSTETWATKYGNALAEYPKITFVCGWAVIIFEILFALSLVVPEPAIFVFFALGVLFHFSNALFMGINSFVFIFPATYPALYYANSLIGIGV